MDLTFSIRRYISQYDFGFGTPLYDPGFATRDLEIIALDDLDEEYLIRTCGNAARWLGSVKHPLWLDKVSAPEKGVIEVLVRKESPYYRGFDGEDEDFLKEVENYFNDLFEGGFRMKAEHVFDKADTSYMKYSSEGDELGWIERESDVYIGTVWTLYYPTCGDEDGFGAAWNEDKKKFVLRKLEKIFGEKGAQLRETSYQDPFFGEVFHYEFSISNF